MRSVLIVIDPQWDFCHKDGALCVANAAKDMETLHNFLQIHGHKLDDIHVTLDSHNTIHIAHPIFWKDPDGNPPGPFTTIKYEDVASGRWSAKSPNFQSHALHYVEQLEKNKRYQLTIWPPHCLIGRPGHSMYKPFYEAIDEWEYKNFGQVNFVTKGSNMLTEHYSAVKADVPQPNDPSTSINIDFINTIKEFDQIFISGEASSHCVANTVTDIADEFGEENIKKLVFLEDTSSPVTGFDSLTEKFVYEMSKRGMSVRKTGDAF